MVVLGLNAFGQNPSASLVIDGKLRAFSHEERFNRLKGSHSLFPAQALAWCLSSQGIEMGAVDKIAINWDCGKYPYRVLGNMAVTAARKLFQGHQEHLGPGDGMGGVISYLNQYRPANYQSMIYAGLRESGFKAKLPELVYVNHHLSHAYQAYYQSGYQDALVLVADGHGEEACVSGYKVYNGEFTRILENPVPYSLGWFYGGFTAYLGFHANRDEGKLMGLAAYGEAGMDSNPWQQHLEKILKVEKYGFELNPYYFKLGGNYHHPRFTDKLVKFITDIDPELVPIGINDRAEHQGRDINCYLLPKYIDLAYAVQTRLEDALQAVVRRMTHETGISKLCLAGGVFMNCKANYSLSEMPEVDELFIHPAASDDGSALGAAYYVSRQLGDDPMDPLLHVQHGACYSSDNIRKTLEICGIEYHTMRDTAAETAKLLAQGRFIGWFQGGAEMGARALGGRSIIACPNQERVKDEINAKVKFREFWRPYCPSLTAEHADDYLIHAGNNPFMIRADKAKLKLEELAPATVHVDRTVRPQIVADSILPLWHQLITETGRLTGVPVLLNTSFNVRGEPIVNSPFDAIRTFYSTGLDALVLGDFLVMKRGLSR